ncbi:MAG TPA: DUF503 domain-containing protein [Candidatus Dormibacteraeota bacterium]|nr:DUF503 domain-containing protein [Candidatus Dormibacteraeota bacterium]
MIVYAEVECMLYEGNNLKDKRALIKQLTAKLRNEFNISVAELDYHDLWQRTKLGIVTISNEYVFSEKVIQGVLNVIDSFTELERTITNIERL